MKVLLVSANTERIKMPSLPLGLSLVATAVRRSGHKVAFLDLLAVVNPLAAIRGAIDTFRPEVIGISVRNIDNQDMLRPRFLLEPVREIIATCRALTDARICLGGAGFSIFPEAALSYLGADLGVCGEGEVAFPALLARLQTGESLAGLPGVYAAGLGVLGERAFVQDLDRLSLPDESLWSSADPTAPDLWLPVQTRRGCPLDCSYCSTAAIEGTCVRFRSPRIIAEHVAQLAEAGFPRLYFVDNTFNLPTDYALELCRAIATLRLGVSWRCILYPHDVPDSLVEAMADAGCVEVSLGFESGSRPVLRMMNKQFEPEEVRQISHRLAAHGIRRLGFLLLGGPGETKQSAEESLAFADALRLDMLSLNAGLRIYPHTALARIAVQEGLIFAHDDLLVPRFYIRPELEDWLRETVAAREA